MFMRYGFWNNKRHYLNKMTLKELVAAYFQYYAIQGYLLVGIVSTVIAALYATAIIPIAIAIALSTAAYPLIWYILHRWVLHGRYLYKSRLTARTWKRIHFDHHQDPHDLSILFGALYTTLPTIALATIPIGWAVDGLGGAAAALAAGMFTTCFYEFLHCIQHLSYRPKYRWVRELKRRHMAHHFHDENGNFGITNFIWDRAFGTLYEVEDRPEKSLTVFNLGYDEDEAIRYPWVAKISDGLHHNSPRERRQASS